MPRRSGTCCSVPGCRGRAINKCFAMHRFPKDYESAERWLIACNREDLRKKSIEQLHKNYTICGRHFEEKMYAGPYTSRLLPTAVPTLCLQLTSASSVFETAGITQEEEEEEEEEEFHKSIEIPSDIEIPCTSFENSEELAALENQTILMCSPDRNNKNVQSVTLKVEPCEDPVDEASPSLKTHLSCCATQTPKSLTCNTPRKTKLRKKLREVRRQLRKQSLSHEGNNMTLKEFNVACEKFLPQSLAKIVKHQARLFLKKERANATVQNINSLPTSSHEVAH